MLGGQRVLIVDDLDIGWRLGPGLGREPERAPQAPTDQLPAQHAEPARKDTAQSHAGPKQWRRWMVEMGWVHLLRRGVFEAGVNRQGIQRRHGQHQPVGAPAGAAVRCGCSHCQPTPLRARKPSSIQKRRPYQLTPTTLGARSVNSTHGSFCPLAQITIKAAVRRAARCL